ncbi:unnamed protein product [Boreogadus saida]
MQLERSTEINSEDSREGLTHRMVGASDCLVKSTARVGKVSKPIMEKKRRARINRCLDQLKTLLESYYTTNIRKRKLEKADILELTVKHLRSLQKIQSCSSKTSGFSDYQAGFHSCLANVHQYLSLGDQVQGSDGSALSHLVSKNVYCAEGPREASSTLDSNTGTVVARDGARQRLLPALNATDSRRRTANTAVGCFGATKTNNTSTSLQSYETLPVEVKAEGQSFVLKQVIGILPSNTPTKSNKVFSVCHGSPRDGETGIQQSMWRPW